MAAPRRFQFDTLSLHAGQRPDPVTGARATPIYFTTSFVFRDSDHAAALFNMERAGHVYSRISNPTNAVLEERIAADGSAQTMRPAAPIRGSAASAVPPIPAPRSRSRCPGRRSARSTSARLASA